jgi:hypothetical protein
LNPLAERACFPQALAALDLSGLAAVDNALLAGLAAAPARLQALALCACKAGPERPTGLTLSSP